MPNTAFQVRVPGLQTNGIDERTSEMVKTEQIQVSTRGNCHVVNITDDVGRAVAGRDYPVGHWSKADLGAVQS